MQPAVCRRGDNGLGYRIGYHFDYDGSGDVDGSDPVSRFVSDDRWRIRGHVPGQQQRPD